MKKWRRLATTKKTARAVFNITNGEKEMQNNHIMALALALCNAGAGQAVKVPAMTGGQLRQLLAWLEVLR